MSEKQTPPLTLHQGLDYAVIMRPDETTDNAFIQVQHPDDDDIKLLTAIVTAHNANADLVTALTRWQTFARDNGWTDADHRTGEVGWISETNAALAKVGA